MSVILDDIRAAARRIEGKAVVTPLLESPLLNQRLGCRVLVKAENLQLTGSFKFRGACNRIMQLDAAARARGVVAYSTGNHAQGVAAAARVAGIGAVIVIPTDAPAIKKENTRAWGAELAFYDREHDDRIAIAERIARERSGAALIPPFDHEQVIAGQGTIGLEIIAQAAALGAVPDAVVIPCGGGGLTAGISTAVKALSPAIEVFMAEPAAYDDTCRSLAAGERLAVDLRPGHATTFCDALTAPMPGEITFPINRRNVTAVLTLNDDTVCRGIHSAFAYFKLVLEPSGAIALAAIVANVLGRVRDIHGKTVVAVASGGNVDAAVFTEALKRGAPRT
ncbi:MAG: pyridoxal-phosphate dependent enzyme [Alphaproteobacteria bacterium]|nr:pyridoxal-phosphate dependent enzyme [Alphaproteobacteria bacterium]